MSIKKKLKVIPEIIKHFCVVNGILFAITFPIVIFMNLVLYVLRLTEFSFNVSVLISIIITFVIFVILSIVIAIKGNKVTIKKENDE
jgi:hypothetical protein